MISRRTNLVGALTAAAIALMGALAAAPAPAASLAPALSVSSLATPTNFVPEDESGDYFYEVRVANGGGAATDGSPITITDRLPAGLVVKSVELPLRVPSFPGGFFDFGSFFCEAEKAGEVETETCTIPEELPFPETEDPALLEAGEELRMIVHVSTPANVSGPIANLVQVQGGGATAASAIGSNEASPTPAPHGVAVFHANLSGGDGQRADQAASHPYQYTTDFAVNTRTAAPGAEAPFVPAGGDVKDIRVALPPGLVGNPTAASRCAAQQFTAQIPVQVGGAVFARNDCPDGSAVGLVIVQQLEGRGGITPAPLYNLAPPKGMPAQLGFQVLGSPFYIDTRVRTGGDYGITAELRNVSEARRVTAARVTVWGVPSDPSHNSLRGSCIQDVPGLPFSGGSCEAGVTPKAFFRLPSSCALPLNTEASFDTWTDPGGFVGATSTAPAPDGCAPLDFSSTISAQPTTSVADSPSGLRFTLHVPQNEDPGGLAEADLKDAVVTLPEGVTVNPSSAGGLQGCSPAQIDLHGPAPGQCPDSAKIGSVEVRTPLLDHPVRGGIFVAAQNDNPFGSLLAIYIAVDDPQTGVVLKLAGHVEPDPSSGRLTTRFDENPQLPFEDLEVHLFEGPRAPLRTPTTCGAYATTTDLKPWSAPDSGADATPSDSFAVATAPNGPCANSEAEQPNHPSFSAGTQIPLAGAYSPLVARLKREDGSQLLRALNVALPPGLLGKLAGVATCPDTALAAAAARSGVAEREGPSCPGGSRLGGVTVGVGAGSSPYYAQGAAYLAGTYKGAPLSMAIVTPAVAGPFDLGVVVVRVPLRVDPETAQVTAVSDLIPTILQGIPLDVRSVEVDLDHPDFTLNPTSCKPMSVGGEAISLSGQVAQLEDRFQVGGCRGLSFTPKLGIRVFGRTTRGGHPRLRATLTMPSGSANIRRAQVTLPRSEFLDQAHIGTVCTRVQFAAKACPKTSIYGHVLAKTPLLDEPFTGPVYLRSSSHELPDLVAALRGPDSRPIEIDLDGRIDSVRGGIRTTFEAVPDAPVSKFILTMLGGKKGLLVNSRNVCAGANRTSVKLDGQNGKVHDFRPLLRNGRCGHGARRKGSRR
jgi:hypothetical protein